MKKKNLSAKKKVNNFYFKKLDDPKINKIYSDFKIKLSNHISNNFCVAVSGGSDSLALSFLAKCYSLEKNIKVNFFLIDHKLRRESTTEANFVKKKLSFFNISCQILTIKRVSKVSNIQSFARKFRYKLLFQECNNKKIKSILTAHHEDDLLENFFIRLLRGSGLNGLASFANIKSKINFDEKILIIRPLIDVSKNDLNYICKKTFDFNVKDPSNNDDKFLRVKVRKLISKLENDGLTFQKFKKTLKNLSKSNLALNYYVDENIKNNSNFLPINNSIVLSENFFKQPYEIVFRSFSSIVQKIGKKDNYARGIKIQNILNYLQSSKNTQKKTLSGCVIKKVHKSVLISPEN